jgi:hypothetical protein
VRNVLAILCLFGSTPAFSQSFKSAIFNHGHIPVNYEQEAPRKVGIPCVLTVINGANTLSYYRVPQVPHDMATKNFGFFCRQELNMQRAKIPVAVRVGSMEQCNQLEQKPGYH